MEHLSHHIRLDDEVCRSPNLTSRFSDDDLDKIGAWVWENWDRDEKSREPWSRRMQAAMDLALQLQRNKTFPWPGCANVTFPLITIAALQYHSRAYPALIRNPDLVTYRPVGGDPTGIDEARALRIGKHMSFQALDEDPAWEEQHDRLLIQKPIIGCAFIKTRHVNGDGNRSELVMAKDLVADYYTKSCADAACLTHIIPLSRNEMRERMLLGTFKNYLKADWYNEIGVSSPEPVDLRQDARLGTEPPPPSLQTPFTCFEQHTWLDLDGDGYAEPYIITIEKTSKKVLRIVARWERKEDVERTASGEIIKIRATEMFTKYTFIPSPDGGFYDLGFGVFLGPLNESVNTLLNQLLDSGTMASLGGGFLGRGAKIRGGSTTFAPLEWKRVDATGDDLRKSIVPLETKEPSNVLFQLLSLLINYTERISGSTDIMVGENIGQNTPKGTADQLVEQGSKIYSAIFKRAWRCMKEEFRKLFLLNAVYLPDVSSFGPSGSKILRQDYLSDPKRISPSCDPNVISDQVRLQKALAIKEAAMVTPGYDLVAVEHYYLRALDIDGVEKLYPGPDKVPPLPNPKLQIEQVKQQIAQMKLQEERQQFIISMMEEQRVNTAKILELEAKAQMELAQAGGVQDGHAIALIEAQVGALKAHDESLRGRIELALKAMELKHEQENPPQPAASK